MDFNDEWVLESQLHCSQFRRNFTRNQQWFTILESMQLLVTSRCKSHGHLVTSLSDGEFENNCSAVNGSLGLPFYCRDNSEWSARRLSNWIIERLSRVEVSHCSVTSQRARTLVRLSEGISIDGFCIEHTARQGQMPKTIGCCCVCAHRIWSHSSFKSALRSVQCRQLVISGMDTIGYHRAAGWWGSRDETRLGACKFKW